MNKNLTKVELKIRYDDNKKYTQNYIKNFIEKCIQFFPNAVCRRLGSIDFYENRKKILSIEEMGLFMVNLHILDINVYPEIKDKYLIPMFNMIKEISIGTNVIHYFLIKLDGDLRSFIKFNKKLNNINLSIEQVGTFTYEVISSNLPLIDQNLIDYVDQTIQSFLKK